MASIIILCVGAAIATLLILGYAKGMKNLFVAAIILALGFLGYLLFWGSPVKVAETPIFKGPIIIKIEPSKGESNLAPETKENLKEFFRSGNARNPFQIPSGH